MTIERGAKRWWIALAVVAAFLYLPDVIEAVFGVPPFWTR
jgi:hypothetical protein